MMYKNIRNGLKKTHTTLKDSEHFSTATNNNKYTAPSATYNTNTISTRPYSENDGQQNPTLEF